MQNYGVLWDMDGVLVDTGELHFQSWVETLKEYGFEFSREFFVSTFGMNNAGILTRVFGRKPEPELLAEIGDKKEAWFRNAIKGKAQPMAGVVAWLEQLKAWGFRQAVASSAPMANVLAVIDELKLGPYFDALVSASAMPGKPDPAVFLESARRIGVEPARCVVVEDAIAGVQAAKCAGMKCIAVLTTNPASALSEADVIAERLNLLPVETVSQLLNLC
jgi:HAD superfamily hydrolase (TIGR01509 family)